MGIPASALAAILSPVIPLDLTACLPHQVLAMRGRGPQQTWLELGQRHPGEDKEVSGSILLAYECRSAA